MKCSHSGKRVPRASTPGHTPGSICYLLIGRYSRPVHGRCHSHLSQPASGDLAHTPPSGARYGETHRDYLASLRACVPALPISFCLASANGCNTASPRLTETQWHGLLDVGIADRNAAGTLRADGTNSWTARRDSCSRAAFTSQYGRRSRLLPEHSRDLFLFGVPGGPPLADFLAEHSRNWVGGGQADGGPVTSAPTEAIAGLDASCGAPVAGGARKPDRANPHNAQGNADPDRGGPREERRVDVEIIRWRPWNAPVPIGCAGPPRRFLSRDTSRSNQNAPAWKAAARAERSRPGREYLRSLHASRSRARPMAPRRARTRQTPIYTIASGSDPAADRQAVAW